MTICPNRLRELRLRKYWAQFHMQSDESLHIDQSDYSKYERGVRKIPLYTACRLADKFDISLDYMTYATEVREHYAFRSVASNQNLPEAESLPSESQHRRLTGGRLRELRRRKHLNQTEVASQIGLNQSNYSKIEKGIRLLSLERCRILAAYLQTSMDYLAGRTDIEDPYPDQKS